MKCVLLLVPLLSLSFFSNLSAAEVHLNGHTFTIPDGFEIALAGTAPIVNRPITADFDEQGRLYVGESSGTNDKIQVQLENKPHRVLRLEDTDQDGVFDKSTVFADKMMFPEGTMWYAGSLYVSAPPSIWKLTDTDDDGIADQREEWHQGKTLTGCANDLHGPYLGLDGWIYWCKGAFAEQTYTVNGKTWKTKASQIFRCRPDGTGIEPVMTGGMDNPVDVVLMPNGDRILSNTFIVHPGNGLRDGLLHAIYGGVYGKEHGVLDGHPRTGELMPILSHMGPAAACGMVRYESDLFGKNYRDNLFCCQFNKRLVSRHELTPKGASYESKDSDFVVSTNTDFHPTDVLEDADGSLLIVDTGGWYKLCCPSSQLHKPDILGALYRVRKIGARKVEDPRGLKIDWKKEPLELPLLTDDRPAVRARAIRTLRSAEQGVLAAIERKNQTGAQNVEPNLLWAVGGIDNDTARAFIRKTAQLQSNDTSRAVALHWISLNRDRQATPILFEVLLKGSAMHRRVAAEALGRIGEKSAVPELLQAADHVSGDRALEHAVIYALIEIADSEGTSHGLTSNSPRVQRAALIALDQMAGGGVKPDQILARLDSAEPLVKETANWLVSRHPEWGGELAGWFEKQLSEVKNGEQGSELESLLVRHARHPAIQELLAKSAVADSLSMDARQLVLRVMAQANPAELPGIWGDSLAKLVAKDAGPLSSAAVATARDIPPGKKPHAELNRALLKFAANEKAEPAARLNAMSAIQGGMPEVTDEQFGLLLASLHPDRSVVERSSAAEAIAKAKLNSDQLIQVAETTKTVGPLELDRLLAPFERSTDEKAGLLLLDSLKKASSLSSLRIDSLQQKLAKYSPSVQKGIVEVVALVNVDAAAQKQQLEELLSKITGGDVRRGQAVFNSTKAACTACHKFGYLGGPTGPDLTHIGGIRTERDLLESILFPSLSFVRSYEPVAVVTVDGRIVNGLIRNETSSELLLSTGPNQEVRVPRSDVEEIRPSTVSVMPAGLDKQLTTQEMADLVAFLKNAK